MEKLVSMGIIDSNSYWKASATGYQLLSNIAEMFSESKHEVLQDDFSFKFMPNTVLIQSENAFDIKDLLEDLKLDRKDKFKLTIHNLVSSANSKEWFSQLYSNYQ